MGSNQLRFSVSAVFLAELSAVIFFQGAPAHADPEFIALVDLPGGNYSNSIRDMSDDGSVLIGSSSVDSERCTSGGICLPTDEAFIWTADVGMIGLGDLPGGRYKSHAAYVSSDGSAVTGVATAEAGTEAFYWTAASGMIGLGDLPGGRHSSSTSGISADGTTVVGNANTAEGFEAFRWTAATGMVGLGDLPGVRNESTASDVSADGSVVVGRGLNLAGQREAFRWTAEGGMVGLGDLPSGDFSSWAFAVSQDGSVVVGLSHTDAGWEAFRWTAATGMVGLGELPGGTFHSTATMISKDGSTIVGSSESMLGRELFYWNAEEGMVGLGTILVGSDAIHGISADGSVIVGSAANKVAFVWDAAHGMRDLAEVLTDAGVDLSTWTPLPRAYAVSKDGRTIAGAGRPIRGTTQSWVVIDALPKRVNIDFDPDSDVNHINPQSRQRNEVIILGSETLDVRDIDIATLSFGPDEAQPAGSLGGRVDYLDDDRFLDLISKYRSSEMGLTMADDIACITGSTFDGTEIEGCDVVNVLPLECQEIDTGSGKKTRK